MKHNGTDRDYFAKQKEFAADRKLVQATRLQAKTELTGRIDVKRDRINQAYRVTPTGLYLISTAYQGKRNVQFAFRALGISDEPPLLLSAFRTKITAARSFRKAANSSSTFARKSNLCRR